MFLMLFRTPISAYAVNTTVMENVTKFKYLAVFIASDLSWRTRIECLTDKALKQVGFVKRSSFLANSDTKLRA